MPVSFQPSRNLILAAVFLCSLQSVYIGNSPIRLPTIATTVISFHYFMAHKYFHNDVYENLILPGLKFPGAFECSFNSSPLDKYISLSREWLVDVL